jgi:hypothetical protein
VASVALDNDVVAKCATYSLLFHIAATLGVPSSELGVLGTILFVIKKRHLTTASIGCDAAHEQLTMFVKEAEILEPSEEESQLAAKLEEAALEISVQFDVGESQLCAIVVCRKVRLLCTGDKRAMRAMERLLNTFGELSYLMQRVLPYEGLVKRMLPSVGYANVRESICASRGTDTALEICFQCHRDDGSQTEAIAGLESYLNAVARDAQQVFTR